MRIARVFPRRTNATPDDELVFTSAPLFKEAMPEFDEVHISVAFSWDMKQADWLYEQWQAVGVPVKIGGPAFNEKGGEFVSGLYLKKGYTITSRGCPNRCWFCAVPKREGYQLRELQIKDGFNILDDNLLACSDQHIKDVFAMLKRQPHKPIFTGGLEAKILKPWHCEALVQLKPQTMYFAYDTEDDLEPLMVAGQMLRDVGFKPNSHQMGCYVLIGYPKDTMEKAEQRLTDTIKAAAMPYAMLYRDKKGAVDQEWKRFQREWLRPAIVGTKFAEVWK